MRKEIIAKFPSLYRRIHHHSTDGESEDDKYLEAGLDLTWSEVEEWLDKALNKVGPDTRVGPHEMGQEAGDTRAESGKGNNHLDA
jgi:hypothetical protein